MMLDDDSDDGNSIASEDLADGITSVVTVDEMLREGLLLAGFSMEKQAKQPKSNLQDFIDRCGSPPAVLACIWVDLQSTTLEEAHVPVKKRILKYFFMAHHFLKRYPTESQRKVAHLHVKGSERVQTQREWVWYYCERMQGLKAQKIVWPESHINGDDIWVGTVDGTMAKSYEIAGEEATKDPKMFSHKHHQAGFNAEVVVSVKESRCIWINGPGPAGAHVDLVLFRDGLKAKLQSIGKKLVADGGCAGEPELLSTPNGHDNASVREFKSRALKRHEKFNGMLKSFRCLADEFCHTTNNEELQRFKCCFEAVAVICQCQLEKGRPLYNIYVGDMQ